MHATRLTSPLSFLKKKSGRDWETWRQQSVTHLYSVAQAHVSVTGRQHTPMTPQSRVDHIVDKEEQTWKKLYCT
jgi:hypothetical protein